MTLDHISIYMYTLSKYLCINQPIKRYKIFQTLYVIIGVILTVYSFNILRQSKIWCLKYL